MKSDSTEVLYERVYDDFTEALSAIGDSLAIGAEHVYAILVRQQIVNAYVWCFIFLISSIIMIICLTILFNILGDSHGDPEPKSMPKFVASIIVGILNCILFITCLVQMNIVFTGFFNPEYGAIKELMNLIR